MLLMTLLSIEEHSAPVELRTPTCARISESPTGNEKSETHNLVLWTATFGVERDIAIGIESRYDKVKLRRVDIKEDDVPATAR